ncbi:multiprotein-bridging factor 1 family protein [Phytohabitans flavus]|uniref:helix-turn-helix domain-containing protein n=1 Tax=Phytohabitans flavus TaxID=1076124 RepID=UPI00363D7BEA
MARVPARTPVRNKSDMAPQNAEATVGSLLRRYRLAAGLSQQELATGAAVSVRTIRDIERERVDSPRAPRCAGSRRRWRWRRPTVTGCSPRCPALGP